MKIKALLIAGLFSLMIAFSVAADTYMVQVNTTEPATMMGREMPGRTDTTTIWFGDKMMSMKSDQMQAIIRNDKGFFYILMPHNMQYVEFPLSMLSEKIDSDSGTVEPSVSAIVTDADSTKNIGPWKCRKYFVELTMKMGMTSRQEIWATEDVDIDFQSLAAASMGMMAAFPGYDKMLAEWSKVKGLPVETNNTLSVMGASISSFIEVILVTTKAAPARIYDIPEGYSKVDASQLSPH